MIRAILVDDKKSHLTLLAKKLELYSLDIEIIGLILTLQKLSPILST